MGRFAPRTLTRTPPVTAADVANGEGDRTDAIVALYLRAVGGRSSHGALTRFAARVGLDPHELDRALVRAERDGSIRIDAGDPPGSATRTVHFSRATR